MPKKFKGENSKAVEARARKNAELVAKQEQKQREIEDEYWRDDDKHLMKKQNRKEEKEKKRQEALEKKREKEKLFEEEMSSVKSAKPPPAKITRAEIEANKIIMAAEAEKARAAGKEPEVSVDELPLEENVNRLVVDGEEARGIDEALSVLSVKEAAVDRHPEKRVKAAYLEYEEKNLPILKMENPNMRLSQLKQMLKKDWMKSPENPMNQRFQ